MSGRQDFSEEHNWFNQWRLMDVNTEKEILNTVNTIFPGKYCWITVSDAYIERNIFFIQKRFIFLNKQTLKRVNYD